MGGCSQGEFGQGLSIVETRNFLLDRIWVERVPEVLEGFMEVIRAWRYLASEVEYRLSDALVGYKR